MTMPRGAMPTPRSALAASEPYRPAGAAEVFVPSGELPTPNQELAAARPYRASGIAPESFIVWPMELGLGGSENLSHSSWAEEAFAKACAEPRISIPAEVVLSTARECGSANFAEFMQTHGFRMEGKAYLDGPFYSVDWTNVSALKSAIATVGPVKIGVSSADLATGAHGKVTPGTSGWAIYGLPASQPQSHCASLCGFGALEILVGLFSRHGVNVNVPPGMPAGLCYALFTWGSIGIVDSQSLINITGEAWVRKPTTVVKPL